MTFIGKLVYVWEMKNYFLEKFKLKFSKGLAHKLEIIIDK